jgi:hypothetical protein
MGRPNVLIPIALGMAIASNLENLAMSIMLPVWTRDVKTLRAAWAIRKELKSAERCAKPATLKEHYAGAGPR